MRGHAGGRSPCGGTDLVVAVHKLQAAAGLLLLHVAQRALEAEDHVLVLLHDLCGARGSAAEACEVGKGAPRRAAGSQEQSRGAHCLGWRHLWPRNTGCCCKSN